MAFIIAGFISTMAAEAAAQDFLTMSMFCSKRHDSEFCAADYTTGIVDMAVR